MKYVVTVNANGREELFVFPKHIDHDRFAEVLSGIRTGNEWDWERMYREPISAGFVMDGVCFGESITLGLKSRKEEDTALLQKQMECY